MVLRVFPKSANHPITIYNSISCNCCRRKRDWKLVYPALNSTENFQYSLGHIWKLYHLAHGEEISVVLFQMDFPENYCTILTGPKFTDFVATSGCDHLPLPGDQFFKIPKVSKSNRYVFGTSCKRPRPFFRAIILKFSFVFNLP